MASEDSDQLTAGCLPIHRFDDLCDFNETSDIEMPAVPYQSHAACELLEITLLRRAKRMSLEEGDYRPHEVLPPVHDELAQMFTMVVLALVNIDAPDTKEALELL